MNDMLRTWLIDLDEAQSMTDWSESCCLCRLAELGSQTMLQQLLVDNFLHCDLHPGNILASPICTPRALVGLCVVPEWRGASLSLNTLHV